MLDEIDRSLIRLLSSNARQKNRHLAEQIGMSESACLRRIKLLEDRGIIRGYVAVLDHAEAPEGLTAIVTLTLERQSENYLSRFEAAARRSPEIKECYLMTGGCDYFLRVMVRDTAAYETLHKEVLSRLPGVAKIQTSFAMRDALRPNGKRCLPR